MQAMMHSVCYAVLNILRVKSFAASGQVRDKNESRFEEVTYSTVKASSTDPSHICASVNPSS